MNKHSNLGFSSILLSFVMICIVTFSALALLTANADYKLSQKVHDNNEAYFKAEEEAYRTLSQFDKLFLSIYENTEDKSSYFSNVASIIGEYKSLRYERHGDNEITLSFSKPINEQSYLSIVLSLCYPDSDKQTFYEIRKWERLSIPLDEIDQSLHVIGSDDMHSN